MVVHEMRPCVPIPSSTREEGNRNKILCKISWTYLADLKNMGLGMSLSSHIALVLFSTLVIWIRVLPFHKRVCLTNLKNMLASKSLVPLAEFSVIRGKKKIPQKFVEKPYWTSLKPFDYEEIICSSHIVKQSLVIMCPSHACKLCIL